MNTIVFILDLCYYFLQKGVDCMGNTIPTTVRIPEELKTDLEEISNRENRSLNNLINIILQSYVNEDKAKR